MKKLLSTNSLHDIVKGTSFLSKVDSRYTVGKADGPGGAETKADFKDFPFTSPKGISLSRIATDRTRMNRWNRCDDLFSLGQRPLIHE